MAIEILRRGVIPDKEQEFVKACPNCKSQLKFLSGDARREHHSGGFSQREPDYWSYSINCPVCKAVVKATSNA